MLPLGGAGVAAILAAVFLFVPAQVRTLLQDDPSVHQRLRQHVEDYLADPDRGILVINQQVSDVLNSEENLRESFDEAVGNAVAVIPVESTVSGYVEEMLQQHTFTAEVSEFLQSDGGQAIVTDAIESFLNSPDGKRQVEMVASGEFSSPNFQNTLVHRIDSLLDEE